VNRKLQLKKIWGWNLSILAVLYLFGFSYPAFVSSVNKNTQTNLDLIQWVSWGCFAIDLVANFTVSKDKRSFLKKNPLLVLSVLLPFLRPLRLLRLFSFGTLMLDRVNMAKSAAISLKVLVTALFLTYLGGIEVTVAERAEASGSIKNAGDGLWWALTTVTNTSYGDYYPITTEGRMIAMGLMFTGIGVLAFASATIAAWFVKLGNSSDSSESS
jgi:voltage-gated potassium channel